MEADLPRVCAELCSCMNLCTCIYDYKVRRITDRTVCMCVCVYLYIYKRIFMHWKANFGI
jgi:hypothetical protein